MEGPMNANRVTLPLYGLAGLLVAATTVLVALHMTVPAGLWAVLFALLAGGLGITVPGSGAVAVGTPLTRRPEGPVYALVAVLVVAVTVLVARRVAVPAPLLGVLLASITGGLGIAIPGALPAATVAVVPAGVVPVSVASPPPPSATLPGSGAS
jgi:hypothetical protein